MCSHKKNDPSNDDGLCGIARLGLFSSAYFETPGARLARGIDFENECTTTDFLSGSADFFGVKCYGRPWTIHQLESFHPNLPRNHLSDAHLVELYRLMRC